MLNLASMYLLSGTWMRRSACIFFVLVKQSQQVSPEIVVIMETPLQLQQYLDVQLCGGKEECNEMITLVAHYIHIVHMLRTSSR